MRVADGPESRGPAGETPQRLDPLPGPRPEPTGGDWNAQEAVRAAAHGELSTELLQQSVDRLFAIAVTTAGLACVLCIGVTLAPHAPWTDMWRGQFAALAALGALYAALTRYRRLRPAGVLDLGYVHLFATCLLLGFIRYSGPLPTQGAWLLLAPSSLPILAFATLIPAKPRIALSTSIAAALLDPLCASLLGVHRVVPLAYLALWGASPLVAAGIGFGMSRALHRLSASIAAAIEVGSYRLVDRLGTGGMAEVWRADHRMLARPAAVKLIRTEILEGHGPEASARLIRIFLREARVTATLESPHTIQLYDFGITREGALYYVMELLDGLDLKSLVERFGPLPPERAVYLLRQMCRSLGEAHERGLIHRDVKPANVFACRYGGEYDFVKVLDFGLVLDKHPTAEEIEDERHFVGTPAVMAPEMVRFQAPVDARADIYSVGCVGYWLITGQRVFEAQTRHDMLVMHAHQKPLRPSKRVGHPIHTELEDLLMQCLEKNPGKRPQTARELVELLESLQFETTWTEERARLWWRRERPTEVMAGVPRASASVYADLPRPRSESAQEPEASS